MRRWLVVAAVGWLVVLASAWSARAAGSRGAWPTLVYAAASLVCHQRPERSFSTAGVQWPVCGRCAGLYLAAPLGAIIALWRRRGGDARMWLLLSAVPTATTVWLEWSGFGHLTSVHRALAALPLGAMLAFVLVDVAPDRPRRPAP